MRFAIADTAPFEILCRPELYDSGDPTIDADRSRIFNTLCRAADHLAEPDPVSAGTAAWALVHGLATLHRQGMLPAEVGEPLDAFRTASTFMFR